MRRVYCPAGPYEVGQTPLDDVGTPNAIWTWDCQQCTVQFNEAHHTHSPGVDGGAFDIDWDNVDNVVQYNYGHDRPARHRRARVRCFARRGVWAGGKTLILERLAVGVLALVVFGAGPVGAILAIYVGVAAFVPGSPVRRVDRVFDTWWKAQGPAFNMLFLGLLAPFLLYLLAWPYAVVLVNALGQVSGPTDRATVVARVAWVAMPFGLAAPVLAIALGRRAFKLATGSRDVALQLGSGVLIVAAGVGVGVWVWRFGIVGW